MLIVSLQDVNCAAHIIDDTELIEQLTTQLCALYSQLPRVMDPADIDAVEAKWGYIYI